MNIRSLIVQVATRTADRLLFWVVMVSLLACCIGWSLPALLVGRLLPARSQIPFGQHTAMLWCRWFIWVMQATGRCHFNFHDLDTLRADKTVIIVPNHPGLLDAIMVISRLPRVTCIAKAALWNNLFFGAGIRLPGYLRNDSARAMLRSAVTALGAAEGCQLLIFPEGTRSTSHPVSPFRPGFAAIARRAGVDVQTVLIESNTPYLSKSWPLLRMPHFPLIYSIRLGRRFTVTDDPQTFTTALEQYFRAELSPAALVG